MGILPPELKDRILDQLHDDKQSLFRCRAVCKQMVPCANYHLFSHLDITWKTTASDLDALFAQRSSTIPPYVRSLCLSGVDDLIDHARRRWVVTPETQLWAEEILIRLPKFSALQQLVVQDLDYQGLSFDAQRVLSVFLPNLVALELINVHFSTVEAIREWLVAGTSLRRLCLIRSPFRSDAEHYDENPSDTLSTSASTIPCTQLQHIWLQGHSSVLGPVTLWIPTAHLTLVEIEGSGATVGLLRRAGASLQHLKLAFRNVQGRCLQNTSQNCYLTTIINFFR